MLLLILVSLVWNVVMGGETRAHSHQKIEIKMEILSAIATNENRIQILESHIFRDFKWLLDSPFTLIFDDIQDMMLGEYAGPMRQFSNHWQYFQMKLQADMISKAIKHNIALLHRDIGTFRMLSRNLNTIGCSPAIYRLNGAETCATALGLETEAFEKRVFWYSDADDFPNAS